MNKQANKQTNKLNVGKQLENPKKIKNVQNMFYMEFADNNLISFHLKNPPV